MQMIDVLKRLAELDAQNPNIVKESQQPVDECGMMGGMGTQPHTPASINMTAATGEELSSMLKDIMTLAGQAAHDEPVSGADGIAVVDVEPDVSPEPEVGSDEPSIMRSMLDKMNPADDEEEKVDEYDNSPDEQIAGYDAAVPSGNDLHKEKQQYPAAQRGDNAMAVAYESLMAEYKKFINEDQNSAEGMSDHEDELSIRSAVLDVLQTIYDGASAGEEMIDTVADELGDYYDEVEQSGDNELMKAYRFVREKGADAEGNPEMMAKVVKQAMSVLGNDQGMAEGGNISGGVELSPEDRLRMMNPQQLEKILAMWEKKAKENPSPEVMAKAIPQIELIKKVLYSDDQGVAEDDLDEDPITGALIGGALGIAAGVKGAHHANKNTNPNNGFKGYAKNFAKGIVDPRTYIPKKKKEEGVAEADPMESMLKLAGLKK